MQGSLLFLFLSFIVISAQGGYYGLQSWWRSNKATQLVYTAAFPTLNTWSCTAVTVQRRDKANRKSTFGVHVVTLSGANVYYYSDSVCTNQITDITITAPAHSATVYVSYSTNGAQSATVSSGDLTSAVQNTTVSLNPYTWMGGGGNANWNTAANWFGGVVPGVAAGQAAHFDGNCVTNCSPLINANISVRGIKLHPTYSGTVNQGTGFSFSPAADGFIQHSGTFLGSNANIALTGIFVLKGGTFTSTSATLSTNSNFTIAGSPTFNHNNGTLFLSASMTLTPSSVTYYHVTFAGGNAAQSLNNGTMIVNGTLTFADTNTSPVGDVNSGTILAYGNIALNNLGKDGTAIIRVVGSSNQTITSSNPGQLIPHFEIASTGGTVSFVGAINFSGNFTYNTGTVDTGTSTFIFSNGLTITPGNVNYYNVTFTGGNTTQSLNNGTMIVNGTLTLADTNSSPVGDVISGTILAYGNIAVNNWGKEGTAIIRVVGSSNQTITSSNSNVLMPHFEIASTGGTVSFVGTINYRGNFTHASGNVDTGTSTFVFASTQTITPGTMAFSNVTFTGGNPTISLNSGTMIINGTFTLGDSNISPGSINSGTIEAKGDVTTTNYGKNGTALIRISGSTNQTLTGVGTNNRLPQVDIASTGGTVSIVGSIMISGSTFAHSSGTVNAGTSTLIFFANTTITPGSMIYSNVSFAGANSTQNLNTGTMTVSGTLTLADGNISPGSLNNGTIEAKGDVTTASYGKFGTALIRISGSTNQTVTGVGTNNRLPQVEIASTGGTVSLVGSLYVYGSTFTHSGGTVNAGTSTVLFVETTTITPGSMVYNNVTFAGSNKTQNLNTGTMTVSGTLTLADSAINSSAINNGTIEAKGDFISTNYGKFGTALVRISGSTNQTITGTGSNNRIPQFEIASTGGTVLFTGTPYFYGATFVYSTGTVDAGTSTLLFVENTTITPGSITYNNVWFAGANKIQNLNAGTMNVGGTLTIADSNLSIGDLNNGTLNAYGNIVFSNYGKEGSAVLNVVGTASATITDSGTTSKNFSTNMVLNKTGGATLTLASAVNLSNAGQGISVTSGNILMSGFALTTAGNTTLGGTTLTKSGGVLTVNGSVIGTGSLLGGTVNP